jgi:acetyltransferase-like isoleucine patch superfamily enzyme
MLAQRFLVPQSLISLFYLIRDRTRISWRAEVELSPNLRFGPGCTVSSFSKIKATSGPLTIGARSGFGTGCFVSSGPAGIEIGADVLCGPNVAIVGSSYLHEKLDVPFAEQGLDSKGVRIGNNVWIGANSVVADGAVLRDNTIVVANSTVTRRYPPNVIIQGSPARVILRRG